MNNRTSLLVSVISAAVAAIALLVSLYANHISSRAYELSQQAFLSERRVTLRSQKQKDFLLLETLEETQEVNHITIYFPITFHIEPMVIVAHDMRLSEAAIRPNIKKYIDAQTKPIKDSIQYIYNYSIPALFIVLGHTKGTATMTYAVYDLIHEYTRPPSGDSTLILKSAVLNIYLENRIANPQQYIDKLFEQTKNASNGENEKKQPF